MILIDLRNKGLTGKLAEKALELADITANKNMVPFDDQSPFITSGIRLGTPAITTRGLNAEDMRKVADLIDQCLMNPEEEANLQAVKAQVNQLMAGRDLFQFSLVGSPV